MLYRVLYNSSIFTANAKTLEILNICGNASDYVRVHKKFHLGAAVLLIKGQCQHFQEQDDCIAGYRAMHQFGSGLSLDVVHL